MPGPSVREVAMASPDVIRIEIADPPVGYGAYATLDAPVSATRGQWALYQDPTRGNVLDWGKLMGLPDGNGKFSKVKFRDKYRTLDALVRTDIKDHTQYGLAGTSAPSITQACYLNDMDDQGMWAYPDDILSLSGVTGSFQYGETVKGDTSNATGRICRISGTDLFVATANEMPGNFTIGETITGQTSNAHGTFASHNGSAGLFIGATRWKHYIYLKLDAALTNRTEYTISFPASFNIADFTFTFDDRKTRSCAIKGTHIGHRPNDIAKVAYLTEKVYGLPTTWGEGAIDFINDYDLTGFQIINKVGSPVWPADGSLATLTQRATPTTPEYFAIGGNTLNFFTIWVDTPSSFTVGETITGATSHATAKVSALLPTALGLEYGPGDFQVGEVVTGGTSGETATVTAFKKRLDNNASSTATPLDVTDISHGAGVCTITLASGQGANISNGDILYPGQFLLSGSAAISMSGVGALCVANKSGDTFQFYPFSGGWSASLYSNANAYTHGAGALGPSGDKIFKAYDSNVAGSYVFEADYSAFAPIERGMYRVRIPGLGVSDEFPIDNDVYHRFAAHAAKGEYHQRFGTIDGRFGFTRPSCFRPGVPLKKSRMPNPFSNQGGGVNSIPVEYGALGDWDSGNVLTATTEAGAGPGDPAGTHDAGDFDGFQGENFEASTMLLQLADVVPAAFAATSFNIPKLSTLFGSAYLEIDDAPDIIHQVGYILAWYKNNQEVAGGVPGGIDGSVQTSINDDETPSQDCIWPEYAFLPDHYGTLFYAGAAAMFGRILCGMGYTTLGKDYLASAEKAFSWAYDIYQHLQGANLVLTGVSGQFVCGETIQDGSGNTAIVWSFNVGASSFDIIDLVGTLSGTVTGQTSGATGTVSSITTPEVVGDSEYYYRDATNIMASATFTGDCSTSNNTKITNIPDTSGLKVGNEVVNGTCLNVVSRIKSIDDAHTITLLDGSNGGARVSIDGAVYGSGAGGTVKANGTGVTFTTHQLGGGQTKAQYVQRVAQVQNRVNSCARVMLMFAGAALGRAMASAPNDYTPTAGGGDLATAANYYRGMYEANIAYGNGLNEDAHAHIEYASDFVLNNRGTGAIATSKMTGIQSGNVGAGSRIDIATQTQPFRFADQGYSTVSRYRSPIDQVNTIFSYWWNRHTAHWSGEGTGTTNDAKRLGNVATSLAFNHGCNPMGYSLMCQFGPRWFTGQVHNDASMSGQEKPAGIVPFGSSWAHGGFGMPAFRFNNDNFAECMWSQNPSDPGTAWKVFDPPVCHRIKWHMLNSPWNFNEAEGAPRTWLAQIYWGMFLHGFDGNTQNAASTPKVRMTAKAS